MTKPGAGKTIGDLEFDDYAGAREVARELRSRGKLGSDQVRMLLSGVSDPDRLSELLLLDERQAKGMK